MSPDPFGAPPPAPLTENLFFNAAQPTVTLLVEGARDAQFWRQWAAERCRIRVTAGRPQALGELEGQRAHSGQAFLLAVLDPDLDRLEGTLPGHPDVVWTDAPDLEGTLLGLPALERLLAHCCPTDRRVEAERRWGEPMRARLYRHAEALGRLRWLKRREVAPATELKFSKDRKDDKIPRPKYAKACGRDWTPDFACALNAILDFTPAHALRGRVAALQAACAELGPTAPEALCNGHDLLGFLAEGVKTVGGGQTPCGGADDLAQRLHLAVDRAMLVQTEMWQAIRRWEALNVGLQALAAD